MIPNDNIHIDALSAAHIIDNYERTPTAATVADWVDAYTVTGLPVFVRPANSKAAFANCSNCPSSPDDTHMQSCRCLTCHGKRAATTDRARALTMLVSRTGAALSIATGQPFLDHYDYYSNPGRLIVLDIDPRNGGERWLGQARTEGLLPPTLCALTPSGGLHLYYATHSNIGSGTSQLADGIDHKCLNGSVSVPPQDSRRWSYMHNASSKSDGDPRTCRCSHCHYWRADPMQPAEWLSLPITPLHPAIETALQPKQSPLFRQPHALDIDGDRWKVNLSAMCARIGTATAGSRNNETNRTAFIYGVEVATGRRDYSDDDIAQLIDAAMYAGLPQSEATATVRNAVRRGIGTGSAK